MPTLVLAAEHDRMVHPSTPRLLARRIPGARLHVVPGASHFFLLRENCGHVARVVTGFLDGDHRPQREAVSMSVAPFAAT